MNDATPLLWQQFKGRGCQKAREQLIERHAYLCKVTAGQRANKLPASVERADLESHGYVGLIKAVDQFDPARGVQFTTYAIALIQGAILEALRLDDWVPRGVRDKAKAIAQAEQSFENATGRAPSDEELEAALGWTAEQLLSERRLIERMRLVALSEPTQDMNGAPLRVEDTVAADGPAPWEAAWTAQRRCLLWQAIDRLPEREARILRLYYDDSKTFKQIGQMLCVSESRVYQLHQQAAKRLGKRLGEDWRAEV